MTSFKDLLLGPRFAPIRAVRRSLYRHFFSIAFAAKDAWWNSIVASRWMPDTFRFILYRHHPGISLGTTSYIMAGCSFEKNRVEIGSDCYINRGVKFCGEAPILLGDNCAVGFDTLFVTVSHDGQYQDRRPSKSQECPITVGNGVWIGSRVIVLPGAEIGDGCIIAAGAVVRGKCHDHGLYAGVPARRVKNLPMGRFFHSDAAEASYDISSG